MAKKDKKSVVGIKPTTAYSPLRGQNQDYGGVGVKNDNADYTISDEHIHDMNKVAHQPEWEIETPQTRKAIAKKLSKDTDPEGNKRMKKPLREIAESSTLQTIKKIIAELSEGDAMVKNLKPIDTTGGSPSRTAELAKRAEGEKATPAPVDKKKEAASFLSRDEEVEHIEEARGRPKKDSASDSPDVHPIQQARQVISTRGMHPFTFADGKKHQMNPMTAHRILAHHDNLHTPAEKEAFASRIHKSADSLRNWMSGKADDEELPKISLGGSSSVGGLGGRNRPTISGMKPGKKK